MRMTENGSGVTGLTRRKATVNINRKVLAVTCCDCLAKKNVAQGKLKSLYPEGMDNFRCYTCVVEKRKNDSEEISKAMIGLYKTKQKIRKR